MTDFSRRQFLAHSSAILCSCSVAAQGQTEDAPLAPGNPTAVKTALDLLPRRAVELASGPLRDQFQQQIQLFMELDVDKLLKPFRLRAGLPAPGEDMGGWYDQSTDFHVDPSNWSQTNMHGFIPGHSFGQYLSGLSRGYAITGDPAIRDRVALLLDRYAETIGPAFFDDYTLPAYSFDKLVVGLIDAFHHAKLPQARLALDRLTDAALPALPEKALTREERRQRPYHSEAQIWDEPYTLPENLFLAWQRGMGERYRLLALRYLQDGALFDPLAKGVSPFKGKHAYSHVNALSSAIQAYLVTGRRKYLAAAKNGFAFLEAQSFATGGWGPNEELLGPDDHDGLAQSLEPTHRSFETPCGVYGHFKIARSLLQITKDSHYGDSMERLLVNTILGAKPTLPDGHSFYYSDYNHHAQKVYYGDKWPCCSGTFVQLTTDYGISAYFQEGQALYVNLFLPSQVTTRLSGETVSITQSTDYPFANSSRLTVTLARPSRFTVKLRIPAWAGPATRLLINGEPSPSPAVAGRFATLRRQWHDGDDVTLQLDMGLRLEPLNAAHPTQVAVMTGPLVLMPTGDSDSTATAAEWLSAQRHSKSDWLVTTAKGQTIALKPFATIQDEPYRLYATLEG